MKNAIGYIRVSTEEQAEDDRFGIDAQKQAIENYASANGYVIINWFTDTMSGTSDERPNWNYIISDTDISNPPYEAVIAFKNDRVARDTKLYFYYLYVLEKRNIKLLSTQEIFPEGEFANIYRALMLFVAEQERKNIVLRTSAGRKAKAQIGGYSGGRCPYGYKVIDGKLIINEDEKPIVEFIFNEKKKYESQNKRVNYLGIATALNNNGFHTRSGAFFIFPNIKSIIDNEKLYRGLYKYGKDGTWVKGLHEPILKENEDD